MDKKSSSKIVYKSNPAEKAALLEAFLFGKPVNGLFDSDIVEEQEEAVLAAAVAAGKGDDDKPYFFMDTAGKDTHGLISDDDDDDDDEDDAEDSGGGLDDGDGDDASKEDDSKELGTGAGAGDDDVEEVETSSGDSEDEADTSEHVAPVSSIRRKTAAWQDEDIAELQVDVAGGHSRLRKLRTAERIKTMNGVQYEEALRKQHASMNASTAWASSAKRSRSARSGAKGYGADSDEDEDEEEGEGGDAPLTLKAGGLLAGKRSGRLLPGSIEVTRMKDANQHEPHAAAVQSLQFHTGGHPLLMTAGLDKKIRLFQVDGKRNPKVQSIHLDDCPVHQAAFANGGSQIIAAGRVSHFYIYDLAASKIERVLGPSGNPQKSLEAFAVAGGQAGTSDPLVAFRGDQGYIPLVSLKSRQWVGSLKMNGSVRAMEFSPSGQELLTTGSDGVIYTWDMRTRRCMGKMVDYGGNMNAAALAVSPNNKYLASGSGSGVVNVYSREQGSVSASTASKRIAFAPSTPSPLKEIMSLTTTSDTLVFSPDSQILAIASRAKKDSMRLVHMPSLTVFSNWPTTRSPLHYVHSAAFSPNGGFLAIGNAKGRAVLYRLHHYPDI